MILERVKGIEPSYSAWKSPDFPSVFKAHSDILQLFGRLRSLQNFSLSEWSCEPHGVFALIVDFLIVFVVGGASTSADLDEQAMSVNMVGPKLRFHGISPFETGAQHSPVTGGQPKIAVVQTQHFWLWTVPRQLGMVYFS